MPFDLPRYLQAKQVLVNQHLERVIVSEPGLPASLREAMRYSLMAPGKRLRPCLVFMACAAAGGQDESAWPAACAVEMIHTYSLIHDDLPAMDDDDLRRGQPTCHKKYGEALAILAGDALLTLAFQVLAQHLPGSTGAACCLELARGAGGAGMVGGQVDDLAWERANLPHTAEALERIHTCKTGALFRACLRMGVVAAQADMPISPDHDLLQRLERFGHCFGLVFQITDDLLDVEGTTAATGKRTQKDAARGKLTYPGLMGVDESRRRCGALADQAREILGPLGAKAEPLRSLLQFVLERKH